MQAQAHPDYPHEQVRLDQTIEALVDKIDDLRTRPAGGADAHTSQVLKAHFAKRADELEQSLPEPYFGRVDFQQRGESQPSEHYIGREGFEHRGTRVINWRAPLAKLFYQARAGTAWYDVVEDGKTRRIDGEYLLKRNLGIEQQRLIEIADAFDARPMQPGQPAVEITDPDEYLRRILATRRDPRLADIVATIQAQQDELIRAPADQVLVIQGVAGSGKTTIALHRLAFLLYPDNSGGALKPERCIIFGPNRLFLSYIAPVLPGLGVDDLPQTTWEAWSLEQMDLADVRPRDRVLEAVLDPALPRDAKADHYRRAQLKTSRRMGQLLERFVEQRRQPAFPPEGLSYPKIGPLEVTLAISEPEITAIWKSLQSLPLARQQERLAEQVRGRLSGQYDTLVEKRAKEMADQGEKFINGARQMQTEAERMEAYAKYAATAQDEALDSRRAAAGLGRGRESLLELAAHLQRRGEPIVLRANRLRDDALGKDARRQVLDRVARQIGRDVSRHWPPVDPVEDYYHLLSDADLLKQASQGVFKPKELELLRQDDAPDEAEVDLSDLPAIHYLHTLVNGVPVRLYDHVVIDEAQDVAPLQLETIQRYSRNGAFTILGDLAQGIHAHRGLSGWDEVQTALAASQPFYLHEITRSYRSTFEITQFANKVLKAITPRGQTVALAEPFERHGPEPTVHRLRQPGELPKAVAAAVKAAQRNGHQNIAIIAKTITQCQALFEQFQQEAEFDFALATSPDFDYKGGTVLLPVHLAKGMEFEAALVVEADDKTYAATEFDGRLLYVALTRGLHRLEVFAVGGLAKALQ